MTKQPSRRARDTLSMDTFQQMRQDADELLRAARRAAEIFRDRPATSFARLSDLIDEVLLADQTAEVRIARAVDMAPEALTRLRARQLDPAGAPELGLALASLGRMLGLSQEEFLQLASADHVRFQFAGVLRSTPAPEDDPMAGLRAAWERVYLDDPSRFAD